MDILTLYGYYYPPYCIYINQAPLDLEIGLKKWEDKGQEMASVSQISDSCDENFCMIHIILHKGGDYPSIAYILQLNI